MLGVDLYEDELAIELLSFVSNSAIYQLYLKMVKVFTKYDIYRGY